MNVTDKSICHAKRLLYLDGWRGLSIFLVLLGHFFLIPGISVAVLGVEFFFVLSGRLMAEILFIEEYPLIKFFKRRFSRVYPGLAVYALSTKLILSGTLIKFKWAAAFTALTFTYNYAAILVKRAGALDHIWSLCIEEHAYVVLAIIALFVTRVKKANPLPILAVLAVLSLLNGAISYWLFHTDYEATYWRTDVHISSILIAAFIRLAREKAFYPRIVKGPHVALFAALMGIFFFLDIMPTPLHYIIGTPLLALSVNVLDDASPLIKRGLSLRPLATLGLLSFSLYLWQEPFYKFFYYNIYGPYSMLTLAILCGLISFYLIERPARSFLNRNW